MAKSNGGIIGALNPTSFGKCTVTSQTSSGTLTTQPGTRTAQYLVVAGGGSGSHAATSSIGGGGGAGGLLSGCLSVCGATGYPITIGGGGAGGANGSDTIFSTITSAGGGTGGSSYVSIGANAPNGVSTGTKIAEGTGGGGGQNNMAAGSSGSGSFNTNNTQGEGTGSTFTGASGGQHALIYYNFPNYVGQYPTAGGNGSIELYTYSLNNIP